MIFLNFLRFSLFITGFTFLFKVHTPLHHPCHGLPVMGRTQVDAVRKVHPW